VEEEEDDDGRKVVWGEEGPAAGDKKDVRQLAPQGSLMAPVN
jgi:hypothetical protein